MAKILLINGSPNEKGCTFTALAEIVKELQKDGVNSEIFWLGQKPIADCIACHYCEKAGKCIFNDQVNELAGRMNEFDGLIIGSPTYFGSSDGRIRCFMDRFFYSMDPSKVCGKPAAAIVSCRRGGASMNFAQLNMYFLMLNMFVVGSSYWNQVHGQTPREVVQDKEGMATMRILADQMAYFVKCQEAGEKAGIARPPFPDTPRTNFIR